MLKRFFWSLVQNGAEVIGSMLVLWAATRIYSVSDSGLWILFFSLIFLVQRLREGLVQNATMKIAGDPADRFAAEKASLFITFALEFLAGFFFVIVSLFYDGVFSNLLRVYPVFGLSAAFFRWLQFNRQIQLNTRAQSKSSLILLVLTALSTAGAFYLDLDPSQFLLLLAGANLGASVPGMVSLSWKAIFSAHLLPRHWEIIRQFAGNGFLRELLGTLSSRSQIFLTAGLGSIAETALVGVASRYISLIGMPNASFQSLLYVKACRLAAVARPEKVLHFYRRSLARLMVLLLPPAIVIAIAGFLFIPFIHGAAFQDAAWILAVLILHSAIIIPVGTAFGGFMHAIGKPEKVTALVTVNAALTLVAGFVLTYFLGIYGAVAAPILVDLLGLIAIARLIKQETGFPLFPGMTQLFTMRRVYGRIFLKTFQSVG